MPKTYKPIEINWNLGEDDPSDMAIFTVRNTIRVEILISAGKRVGYFVEGQRIQYTDYMLEFKSLSEASEKIMKLIRFGFNVPRRVRSEINKHLKHEYETRRNAS